MLKTIAEHENLCRLIENWILGFFSDDMTDVEVHVTYDPSRPFKQYVGTIEFKDWGHITMHCFFKGTEWPEKADAVLYDLLLRLQNAIDAEVGDGEKNDDMWKALKLNAEWPDEKVEVQTWRST